MTTTGISVGQLTVMTDDTRARVIQNLSPEARRMLARLAALGAARSIAKAVEHLDNGPAAWVREHLAHAGQCAEIAAALTSPTEL